MAMNIGYVLNKNIRMIVIQDVTATQLELLY